MSITALLLILLGTFAGRSAAAETGLRAGDFVAVAGDSITEQRLYSMFIVGHVLKVEVVQ